MAYQVLARKYRPLRFSDVVGQDHVTRTLLNALAQNRIAHGYIFSGHRGIGKTTIARILASALNCRNVIGSPERPAPEPCNQCESCLEIRNGNAVDVIEIDAATNRGIDEIRELRDAARYRPSRDRFKIYILDEAHQITDAAFNALLKTLEEPPDHIVFMMATTQPEDIPQTIRSRCQHFSFHAVKLDDIVGQLRTISNQESIGADDATLALLAEAGDGSMRDALSIMDQAIASAPVVDGRAVLTLEQIRELMGTVSNVVYEQILEAVHNNSSADVLATIARLLDAGNGPSQLARQFVRYLRNVTVAKITQLAPDAEATGIAADLLQISTEERRRAARSAALFTEEELSRFLSIMLRTFDELGYRQEPRFHLELGLLKLVHVQRLLPVEDLLSQLGAAPGSTSTPRPAGSSGPSGSAAAPRPSAAPTSAARPASASAATATTSRPSPFDADRTRKTPTGSIVQETPVAITEGALALASQPALAPPIETESFPQTNERPHLVGAEPLNPLNTAVSTENVMWDFGFSGAQSTIEAGPFSTTPQAFQPAAADPAETNQATLIAAKAGALTELADLTEPGGPSFAASSQRVGSADAASVAEASISAEASNPTEPAVAAPAPAGTDADLTALQNACSTALEATKGQGSAAHAMDEATFTLEGDTLQIQTTVSKAMLPSLINAEAERILNATIRTHRPGLKLKLLPGVPAQAASKRTSRAAAAGSAADLAAKHPLVQQAQQLFGADISNVIDLRDK
ncbi:MAG TPA: DNA polymerase III subunit gamma/tau [Acidobacteriaceae bacterium]|jgi:DNA polymerase-3 subunit gamma/tau